MATIRKRGKSWQAQIRLAECPAKSKSFPTKEAAEHWVRIITHQMLDDKATPPASRHTLATLLKRPETLQAISEESFEKIANSLRPRSYDKQYKVI